MSTTAVSLPAPQFAVSAVLSRVPMVSSPAAPDSTLTLLLPVSRSAPLPPVTFSTVVVTLSPSRASPSLALSSSETSTAAVRAA